MGIFDFLKKPKNDPGSIATNQPTSTQLDSTEASQIDDPQAAKERADLEKLMEFEKKIGAPNSGGARTDSLHESQKKTQEEIALTLRNPFRGV